MVHDGLSRRPGLRESFFCPANEKHSSQKMFSQPWVTPHCLTPSLGCGAGIGGGGGAAGGDGPIAGVAGATDTAGAADIGPGATGEAAGTDTAFALHFAFLPLAFRRIMRRLLVQHTKHERQ